MAKIDVDAEINSVRNKVQTSTPSTPGAGYSHSFVKADGMYLVDQNGIVTGPFGIGGVNAGARVHSNTGQSIPSGVATAIDYDVARWDTDNLFSLSNPTRLTCKTAGIYLVHAHMIFAGGTPDSTENIYILQVNGSTPIAQETEMGMVGTKNDRKSISAVWKFEVDEYVECLVSHDVGSAVQINNAEAISPEMSMQLIEPVAASGGLDIGARVYNTNASSIPDNIVTTLLFNIERYDTDDIHSTVSNTERLTCKTAGKYLIVGQASWDANVTGDRELFFLLNSTDFIAAVYQQAVTVVDRTTIQNISTIWDLDIDDFIEFQVRQISGGALNVAAAPKHSPEFMMQRIG